MKKNVALWTSIVCAAISGMSAVAWINESPCWQANLAVMIASYAYLMAFCVANFVRK